MKASRRIYIIGLLLLLALVMVLEYSLPKKFVWRPTFSQHDHQPFGSAVFDDLMRASLSDGSSVEDGRRAGYSVVDETLYQLSMDSVTSRSILVVAEFLTLTEVDREALLKLLNRGNKVMLVASGFDGELRDTLCFKSSYGYFAFASMKQYVASSQKRDSIRWCKDTVYQDGRIFEFYPHVCRAWFYDSDSLYTRLSERVWFTTDSLGRETRNVSPYAITRKYGAGEITLVSTPLIFTNYGMLDEGNSAYLFRLLSRLKGLPVLRTEAYGKEQGDAAGTPLRYLLSQPPLRWAVYLTMITILLFMIFTARRQQRPIPVVREPANKTIEFVELIGTLYFQKKNHTDLVRKKFVYFTETLRRTIRIDVEDGENDAGLAHRVASKTGVSEENIYRFLVSIRPVVNGKMKVDEENMRRFINDMNEIVNQLTVDR